jgi:hypothetical protein
MWMAWASTLILQAEVQVVILVMVENGAEVVMAVIV